MFEIFNLGTMQLSVRREKFVKLAEARVSKALKEFQLIGNLSNRSAYEYTDEDVKQMFRALQKALDAAKLRFSETGAASNPTFRLEE